jgi:clan AA aspartic protease
MGYVRVKGLIGGAQEQAQEVEFLTDTGAFYTLLPAALAQMVGMTLTHKTGVITADKREVTIGVGAAYLRLSDREAVVLVGVMDVPMPLLGVSALEALGFKVDPVAGTLEPTRPFGPAALAGARRNFLCDGDHAPIYYPGAAH